MTEPPGSSTRATGGLGRAALLEDGVEFDADDAALLRAVDRTGSIARASSALGRSRARALARIEDLEAAFGDLVERRRGGSDGGGSHLTANADALLGRYDRLAAAVAATATVPETVLEGTVTAVEGELATAETDVGAVRGRHAGADAGDAVQVRVGADAVTVLAAGADPSPDATSARNRLAGRVVDVDRGETVCTLGVDVGGATVRALVTVDSVRRLSLQVDRDVVLTWKATATRFVQTQW